MKSKFMLVCLVLSCQTYAQSVFKYQARCNIIPIASLHYSGAGRLGLETINRKYNFGAGLIAYMVDEDKWEAYYKDSLFRRTLHTEFTGARGIALSVMRSLPFKTNNNKWVFGGEVFMGVSRQVNTSTKQFYDTIHSYRGMTEWRWLTSDVRETKHGLKSSFALAIFARLELAINRRFTFTPELNLPFCINNKIGGHIQLQFTPGINFCLGYKFCKQDG